MLCRRLTPPARRRGQPISSLAEYALRTHLAPSSLFLGLCCCCCRYVFDDVSKVTFRLGLGRVWTSSVIFRTLSPICTLVRTRILFRFPLLFVSLYCIYLDFGSLESLLYICSFGIYCKLLWCNHLWFNPPALRVCFRARDVWWASSNRFYAEFGGNRRNCIGTIGGDVTSGIRAMVFDTPLVRPLG